MKNNKYSYIGVQHLIVINKAEINRYNKLYGAKQIHGVKDMGLLESASKRPLQSAFGNYIHNTLEEKAAALAEGIIRNHPFVDGNKRTALIGIGMFLNMNGYRLVADKIEAADIISKLVTNEIGYEDVVEWIKKNITKKYI